MKKRIRRRRIRRFLMSREFTASTVGFAMMMLIAVLMWTATEKDALEIALVAVGSGLFAGLGHLALTEDPSEKYFRANR